MPAARIIFNRSLGDEGTPPPAAMRTAPVLKSLSSMAGEMVAPGKSPVASQDLR